MIKTLIIYHSRTGFTRRYAQWLAQALACRAVEYKDRDKEDFSRYHQLIWCDSVYADALTTLTWLKERLPTWQDKRIAVLAVGAMPPAAAEQEGTLAKCLEGTNLPGFYVQGGLAYDRMGLGNRLLMRLLGKMVKKKEGAESEMYQVISRSFDAADPAALTPLIHWAEECI